MYVGLYIYVFKNPALLWIFVICFAPAVFYNFPAFPIHGSYRKYIFCREYFPFEKFWHMVAYGHACCWCAWFHVRANSCICLGILVRMVCARSFFPRICPSLFVQIFNACAFIPKFPCLRSYYGFCALLAIAEGPLDICSLVVYLVVQYFTR